jgi:hypothetical protein
MKIYAVVKVEQMAEVIDSTPQEIKDEIREKIKDGRSLAELYDDYDRWLLPYETIYETETQDKSCWIEEE